MNKAIEESLNTLKEDAIIAETKASEQKSANAGDDAAKQSAGGSAPPKQPKKSK